MPASQAAVASTEPGAAATSPGRLPATASARPAAEAIVVSRSRPAQMSAIATASASARAAAKSSMRAAVRWYVYGSYTAQTGRPGSRWRMAAIVARIAVGWWP